MMDLFSESFDRRAVQPAEVSSAVSTINRKDFVFVWKVENFSLHSETCGNSIKFDLPNANKQLDFACFVYPNGNGFHHRGLVCLSLKCQRCFGLGSGRAKFKLHIPNGPSREIETQIAALCPVRGDRYQETFHIIKRDVLLNEENGLLPNDTLTIICEVSLLTESVTVTSNEQSNQTVLDNSLSVDLNEMFEKGKLCDIVLVTKDNMEIPAHKLILAARSTVFSAMFEHEMKENQSNRIQIEDIDGEVVKQMLQYVYTGQVANIEDTAEHLLVVADKYALMGLKLICENECVRQLSVQNAADMFCLADYHSAERLRSAAAAFFKQNAAEVLLTDSWKVLATDAPLLMSKMVHTILKQK